MTRLLLATTVHSLPQLDSQAVVGLWTSVCSVRVTSKVAQIHTASTTIFQLQSTTDLASVLRQTTQSLMRKPWLVVWKFQVLWRTHLTRKALPVYSPEQPFLHQVYGTSSTQIRITKYLLALAIRQHLFLDSLTLSEIQNSTCSSTMTRANWNQSLAMTTHVVCTQQWPSWRRLDRTTTSMYLSSQHLVPARNSCSTSHVKFVTISHRTISVKTQLHNWTT